jgi:hypothetical protein
LTCDEKDAREDAPEVNKGDKPRSSGEIGYLELYESGVGKIRLGDNIIFDVRNFG